MSIVQNNAPAPEHVPTERASSAVGDRALGPRPSHGAVFTLAIVAVWVVIGVLAFVFIPATSPG